MITVESHVTFPLYLTMAFVEILDIFAHVSALLTNNSKKIKINANMLFNYFYLSKLLPNKMSLKFKNNKGL